MSNKDYNYDDMETIARNVIKILLRGNVGMEDIIHLSGKSEDEILKIKEELNLEENKG